MRADVQIAIAKKLQPRRSAGGFITKQNRATRASPRAAVGDQGRAARGRIVKEVRLAAIRAANGGAVVGKGATSRGRGGQEYRGAATRAAGCATAVNEGAIGRRRRIEELRDAAVCAVEPAVLVGKKAGTGARAIKKNMLHHRSSRCYW